MKRAAALVLLAVLLAAVSTGCGEDSTEVTRTGFEMRFTDCLTFGVHIFVNDTYQGTCSSEEPKFYPVGAGTYTLFARSNANLGQTYFCWSTDLTVSDGNVTVVTLSCEGAECDE
ncbi:MAG: hypothetical protein PHQ19_08700 [Candidatus Krumholzibacteria bacterium]|nr:hypothetical protein [Candidatus Krumholzibacteria bacterium]